MSALLMALYGIDDVPNPAALVVDSNHRPRRLTPLTVRQINSGLQSDFANRIIQGSCKPLGSS